VLDTSMSVAAFDCADDALNRWLRERGLSNNSGGASRTWVVTEDSAVVAFYASGVGQVVHAESAGKFRRNQPDPLPCVLLARLAVDGKYQHRGIGAALVRHFLLKSLEVAAVVGVRLVVVHAKSPEAASFYEGFGFSASPIDPLVLHLLIRDIAASLR